MSYAAKVKTTRYFDLRIIDRPDIRREWCQRVLENHAADDEKQQSDGKVQMWGYITEVAKYLRIITLEDRETVDNAFFDRRYAPRKNKR